MSDEEMISLCDASDVAPGTVLRAEAQGCAYAVYNVGATLYVTEEECTHGPGELSEGDHVDDEIECPFHQGRFHISSGRATCPPATEPLKCWKAHLIDGTVYIDPSEHEE